MVENKLLQLAIDAILILCSFISFFVSDGITNVVLIAALFATDIFLFASNLFSIKSLNEFIVTLTQLVLLFTAVWRGWDLIKKKKK